jgi:hypothetical protein
MQPPPVYEIPPNTTASMCDQGPEGFSSGFHSVASHNCYWFPIAISISSAPPTAAVLWHQQVVKRLIWLVTLRFSGGRAEPCITMKYVIVLRSTLSGNNVNELRLPGCNSLSMLLHVGSVFWLLPARRLVGHYLRGRRSLVYYDLDRAPLPSKPSSSLYNAVAYSLHTVKARVTHPSLPFPHSVKTRAIHPGLSIPHAIEACVLINRSPHFPWAHSTLISRA